MKRAAGIAALPAAAFFLIPGASLYYEAAGGPTCTACHEMKPSYDEWHSSSHRGVNCGKCHGGVLTWSASFHWNNATRLYEHWRNHLPEQTRLGNGQLRAIVERCRACHRQEFAEWQAGPHSATYTRIFLDRQHNRSTLLNDDCLRCHGMFFEGGVRDLISPVDRSGPWRIVSQEMAQESAVPCLACHSIHRQGPTLEKEGVAGRTPGPLQEIHRPSLALFDRRSERHVPVDNLVLPRMRDSHRVVRMSPDARQALCYQCHAPDATFRVGTADDRTATGVHEGISCLACHRRHSQTTRPSCAECHPRMSDCGLDVEKMDTSFRSGTSRHNIHWVHCEDCHPKGVPKKRVRPAPLISLAQPPEEK